MVIISFDMTTGASAQARKKLRDSLQERGWEKPAKTKTTFRWPESDNSVVEIGAFMNLLKNLGLRKHVTHLVVHMIRD